jgi:hypothetical protein
MLSRHAELHYCINVFLRVFHVGKFTIEFEEDTKNISKEDLLKNQRQVNSREISSLYLTVGSHCCT